METTTMHKSWEVNELVSEILLNCECAKYAKYFQELNKKEFRGLSLFDLKERLSTVDDVDVVAGKIYQELIRFSSLSTSGIKGQNNSCSIVACSSSNSNNSAPVIERSAQKLNELPTNGAIKPELASDSEDVSEDKDYEPLLPPERTDPGPVVEVSLDSSSDSEVGEDSTTGGAGHNPTTSTNSVSSSSNNDDGRYSFRQRRNNGPTKLYVDSYNSDSDSDDGEPGEKRLRSNLANDMRTGEFFSLVTPLPLLKRLGRNPDSVFDQCCLLKILPDCSVDLHQCDLDDPPAPELKHWADFYKKVGSHIHSLDLHIWTWRAPRSKCPYNLLAILKSCKNLEELRFSSQILPQVLEKLRIPSEMTLPSLRRMTILHSGEIIYQRQLKSILQATTNLSSFEYSFHSLEEASSVLGILQRLGENLERFKFLTIRSHSKDGYLTREQILKLTEIQAPNLEELEIGNGLWEDVDGSCFGAMLKTFSKLKKLKVAGNYQGNSLRKPEILLSIPPLPNLEFLDIGGNYEFASIDQREERSRGRMNSSQVITVEDDLKTELFAVSIEFPLLPNLKTLVLGNLFKIDDLHFSSFPSLEAFRVGSPWHLTVKFSSNEGSRKYSYPLITDLQIPDCLKDPSFVENIPSRFPNLRRCWIFLPSVRVLRTFFKGMEHSELEELYLKTQYDFEATMELCLLGKPSQAPVNYRDYMRHEDLEAYGKFSEFVSFYNIELPPKKREELEELEDPTCAGLKVLRSLKVLHLEHIPRVLRIPRGNLHWTHSKAEFTDSYIGFKEYPLSWKCVSQLPFLKNLKTCVWPNFAVERTGRLRDTGGLIEDDGLHFDRVSYHGPCSSSSSPSKPKRSRTSTSRGETLKVQIQPAMLQASIKFHQKDEKG